MPELKTKATQQTVADFLDKIADEQVRDDSAAIIKMMQKATGAPPKMWGPSIIGFGQYHYKYDSGHEGDMCITGFSPRKQNFSLYVMMNAEDNQDLLSKLGKHKTGKACLYVKRLADIDTKILETLIKRTIDQVKKKYPEK
jgi:Domain of unknown function (DU1801)